MMVILADLSGNLLQGYMSYIVNVVLYAAVAAAGIAIGIKLSKNKKKKESK